MAEMDVEAVPRSLMAGTAGLGALFVLLLEVFKWLVMGVLQLYLWPFKMFFRVAGLQRQDTAVTGSALITGCDTGIGRALALLLADQGWDVFAGVLLPESQAELSNVSSAITPLLMDVTDENSIKWAAEQVSAAVGAAGLQLLVNNAGIAHMQPVECCDLQLFRKVLDVNVTGVLATSQAFIPLLRTGQHKGRIINMGSVSGHLPGAFWGPYSTSKHALEGLTDCMRYELEGQGIKVVLIKPGPIKTPIWPSKELARSKAIDLLTTDEAREIYGKMFTAAVYETAKAGLAAVPISEVISVIYHAATCCDPKHRYLVGPTTRIMYWLRRLLPDELFSSIITKLMTQEYIKTASEKSWSTGL